MKDHKQVTRKVDLWGHDGGPVKGFLDAVTRAAAGLADPRLAVTSIWDSLEGIEVSGWVPMTEEELATAKRKREAERARQEKRKAAQLGRDQKELERLASRLGVKLPERVT